MATHRLKTWPEFFQAVKSGAKPFEIRVDDRGFALGDRLELVEFDPGEGAGFTGQEHHVDVTYLLRGALFGLPENSVMMGIAPAPEAVAQRIADALTEADREWGYSIELTRLVDGVHTYTLRMPGFRQDYEDRDEAVETMSLERDKRRAVKVLAALRGGAK